MDQQDLDKFLSWARYLYWSDILYQRFIAHEGQDTKHFSYQQQSQSEWRTLAYSAHWLASLYVVIEGWEELSLDSSTINKLLSRYRDFVSVLRRFRNGVYHYQPQIFNSRLTEFPRKNSETITWAAALMYEFKRWFWLWPGQHSKTPNETAELRAELGKLIGWLPTDVLDVKVSELNDFQTNALTMLREANDFRSPQALEVLKAVEEAQQAIQRIDHSPHLRLLSRL